MASCTSRLLSASAAVLLAVVIVLSGATATAAAGVSTPTPSYCVPGKAIPPDPLSWCVWYVASRSCDLVATMLPMLKPACCQQLQDVPAECRCRALRVMMERPLVVGAEPAEQQRCRAAQRRFAPDVVAPAECGLRTVHGRPFCNELDAE